MLRRFINWFLYKLRLREKPRKVPAVETLLDILPWLIGLIIVRSAMKWLGLSPILYPWHKRLWFKVKWSFMKSRAVLIGY